MRVYPAYLLLAVVLIMGCKTTTVPQSQVKVGMLATEAEKALRMANADEVMLQAASETESAYLRRFKLQNGSILCIAIDKKTLRVAYMVLCENPSGKHGKTLGTWVDRDSIILPMPSNPSVQTGTPPAK